MDILAMAYVDPSSAGMLARMLAPIFILISFFGIQFRNRLLALLRRFTHRSDSDKNDS